MKPINEQAPVVCSKSIRIQASPEKVWSVLSDIDRWAEWQQDIGKSRLNGPLQAGTTFDWKSGGAGIHSTLHTVVPHRLLGWTGKTFGMYAIHNWTLSESSGQTLVLVEESLEGLLARLLKKSFNKSLEKGMTAWLERLKTSCES